MPPEQAEPFLAILVKALRASMGLRGSTALSSVSEVF
jgi:hypothetical protein